MARKKRKRKGRALAKRFGHSRARKGHFNMPGETGVPVRVHGTLFVSPHADERIVDTIAEVVEEIVPELVEEALDEVVPELIDEVAPEAAAIVAEESVE